MILTFQPRFSITSDIANSLIRMEGARQAIEYLPVTSSVLASLRETARRVSTHYSTRIEGNRLTAEQVSNVLEAREHFDGRERDEKEVLGYYAAMEKTEQLAAIGSSPKELNIRTLHALVMAGGRKRVKPTPYREGQNVIRDSRSGRIVYMPPEAKDVPAMMRALTAWLVTSDQEGLPCPIRAGIAHYQFATIHPYYDGNGRTARLLTTLILHLGQYGLKGLYSLEEYYAQDLRSYYEALTVGPSHNYYEGRAETDITGWIEYFCRGAAESFEAVKNQAQTAAKTGVQDRSAFLRKLDARQRKALGLFRNSDAITSRDIEALFGFSQRTARALLARWVEAGFLEVADASKKSRKYSLTDGYHALA